MKKIILTIMLTIIASITLYYVSNNFFNANNKIVCDYNDDGQVSDADAIPLLMHTFFPDDYPINQDGDVNRDGEITDADAIHLLMYTFFPEDYPIHFHEFEKEDVAEIYLAQAATCSSKAKYYYSCECGEHNNQTFEYGSFLDHTYDKKVASNDYLKDEATCTEKAKYYFSCVCGLCGTSTFEDGNPLNHSFTNYVSNKDATCLKDGTKTAKCDRCTETDTISDTGSMLNHTYDQKVSKDTYKKSDATCFVKSSYYYSCICGAKGTESYEDGDVLKHKYQEFEPTEIALYSEERYEYYRCSLCQSVKKDEIEDIDETKYLIEEYVNLINGAYFDTGIYGDANTRIFIEFSVNTIENDGCYIYSSANSDYKDNSFESYLWNEKIQIHYNDQMYLDNVIETNKRYFIDHNKNSFLLYDFDSNIIFNGKDYFEYENFRSNHTITINALSRDILYISTGEGLKVYNVRIYQNDSLLMKLIPVTNKETGDAGFYDTISKTFKTNTSGYGNYSVDYHRYSFENTKLPTQNEKGLIKYTCLDCGLSFTKETDTIDESKYELMEYFESDGRRYVNTGIIVNSNQSAQLNIDLELSSLDEGYCGVDGYLDVSCSEIGDLNRNQIIVKYNDYINKLYINNKFIRDFDNTDNSVINASVIIMSKGSSNQAIYEDDGALYIMKGKCYSAQIMCYGALSANLIPAKLKSNGEIGFYDTVSGKFFINNGTSVHENFDVTVIKQPSLTETGLTRFHCINCEYYYDIEIPCIDPNEYEVVPYIQSLDGYGYINLKFADTQGMTIRQICTPGQFNISSISNTYPYGRNYAIYDINIMHWQFGYGDYDFIHDTMGAELGRVYDIESSTVIGNAYMKVDGIQLFSCDYETSITSRSIYLYANTMSLINNIKSFGCKFYYANIKDHNGVEVRNLIPVINKKTNRAGLYDTVEKVFYTTETLTCPSMSYNEGEVPSEYRKVEYVESDGLAYIDTGYGGNKQYEIDCLMKSMSSKEPKNYNYWFGSLQIGAWNYNGMYGRDFIEYNFGAVYPYELTDTIEMYQVRKGDEVEITINGYKQTVPLATNYDGNTNLYIFACNNGIRTFLDPIRCYWFKVHEGDVVVRNFVPVVRISDNVCGLYDLVEGKFYTNGNSVGTLTYKDYVELPFGYRQVAYIESNYETIINTKYNSGNIYQIDCLMEQVGDSYDGYWFGQETMDGMMYNGKFANRLCEYNYLFLNNDINHMLNMTQTLDGNNVNITINGVTFTQPVGNNISIYPLYIFGWNNGNNPYRGKLRLFYFRIHEGDEVVRDFIPAIREEDNVVGLYDLITKEFYYDENYETKQFISPNIDSIDNYEVVDSITLDYHDYINTNIKSEGTWIIDMESLLGKENPCFGYYYLYDKWVNIDADGRNIVTYNYNHANITVNIGDKLVYYSKGNLINSGFRFGGNFGDDYIGTSTRIYSATFKIGEKTLYEYVPVKNKNGEYGLFETHENIFYKIVKKEKDAISLLIDKESNIFNIDKAIIGIESCFGEYSYQILEKGYRKISSWCAEENETHPADNSDYSLYRMEYSNNGEPCIYYFLTVNGTSYDFEWESNINVGNGIYHQGFENAADFIISRITKEIEKDPEHNKLFVCGHSRGAAVGSIIAIKLMENGYIKQENCTVYAYACPTYSLRSTTWDNIFTINNDGDPITELPLKKWGYRYESNEMILPKDTDTMNRMVYYLNLFDNNVTSYNGFTDTNTLISYLETLAPNRSIAQNSNNRDVILEVMNLLRGGSIDTSAYGLIKKAMLLGSLNGSLNYKIEFLTYIASNNVKIEPSHALSTYRAWIYAMHDIHY